MEFEIYVEKQLDICANQIMWKNKVFFSRENYLYDQGIAVIEKILAFSNSVINLKAVLLYWPLFLLYTFLPFTYLFVFQYWYAKDISACLCFNEV